MAFLEPSEETLRENLIAPLEKRQAVFAANVDTGYVDRKTKRIVSPWTQKFTDLYGLHQDYGSTQRSLKAAVAAGVLEIESHGWTHMQPDLESPPGPWWTADLAGEGSADGWYTEFEDQRRGVESPAIVQLFHLKRSLEYLQKDFAQTPLELRPGGAGWSKSQFNNTGRLAARVGFGLFHAEPAYYDYLDRDLVLDMTGISPQTEASYDRPFHPEAWPAHPDGPVMLLLHDRDIAMQPQFVSRLLESLPANYKTISANHYIAYPHTEIGASAVDGWQLAFNFDRHYCAYFGTHPSSWVVHFSDAFRRRLKGVERLAVSVDGKAPDRIKRAELVPETMTIEIPAGFGSHVWKLQVTRE